MEGIELLCNHPVRKLPCKRCGREAIIPDNWEELPKTVRENQLCRSCSHTLMFNTSME
jgi:hypothetical protein